MKGLLGTYSSGGVKTSITIMTGSIALGRQAGNNGTGEKLGIHIVIHKQEAKGTLEMI